MEIWSFVGKVAVAVGSVKLLFYLWYLWKSQFAPLLGGKKKCRGYGQWAVITGATDGIGKAYAKELAREGLKTVLISRSQSRLDSVAAEIESEFNTEVKTIPFDYLSNSSYDRIEEQIQDLEIGVLVNNVGSSYEHPEYFDQHPCDTLQNLLKLNTLPIVKMTHIVLPSMLKRGKGILIHIASAAAKSPVPMMTVYSATKAFVDFFARALQTEYRSKGIISQAVLPFFVATKLAGYVDKSFFVPDPETYARHALRTVGLVDRTFGYWRHELQVLLYGLLPLPQFMQDSVSLNIMKCTRDDYLRKKSA